VRGHGARALVQEVPRAEARHHGDEHAAVARHDRQHDEVTGRIQGLGRRRAMGFGGWALGFGLRS